MAYFDQKMKTQLSPGIKAVLNKYRVKGSISVNHHSSLVVTLTQGPIDFAGNYNRVSGCQGDLLIKPGEAYSVNVHWIDNHYDGEARQFLTELVAAMNQGNWDRSDSQIDYFNVGWYINVKIGRWDRPYVVV